MLLYRQGRFPCQLQQKHKSQMVQQFTSARLSPLHSLIHNDFSGQAANTNQLEFLNFGPICFSKLKIAVVIQQAQNKTDTVLNQYSTIVCMKCPTLNSSHSLPLSEPLFDERLLYLDVILGFLSLKQCSKSIIQSCKFTVYLQCM